jgi:DNA-binding FadR family transcriptional regulator
MHTITDENTARMPDRGQNIRKRRRDPREHDYAVLALIMRHQVEADGIKEPVITQMFGISDSKLREIIRRLRRSGYPEICSGKTGYYFSLADAQKSARSLKKRALSLLKTVNLSLKELSHKSQISAFEQISGRSDSGVGAK